MEPSKLTTATGPARTDMPNTAMARSHIYGFLAMVFRVEPTSTLLRKLREPGMQAAFADLGLEFGADFFEKPEEELAEELALEYTRLFLGPASHISPHESVHHKVDGPGWGILWGEETVKVKKFIESAGLEYQADYSGLPDHISVELEFLQQLSSAAATAWAEGAIEKARYGLMMERKFIDEHLGRWAPDFCDKVVKNAHLTFYREIAALTKQLLELEFEQVTERLSMPADARH